jgi:hypothetical protein
VEGLDQIRNAATEGAETWRQERAGVLGREVDALGMRLAQELERELAAVREAAKELLGVDLSVPPPAVALAKDARFHYAPPAPEGPTEAIAAAVRSRLGRRRVREHLRASVAETVDRQIGRARASLQHRLQETHRALIATVDHQYREYAAGLAAALRAAEDIRVLTEMQAQSRRTALAEREKQLDELITQIAVSGHLAPLPAADAP